jgi:hypothetical protein
MEFDYFMMHKVLQWQYFWQIILWIITIVQSPGVLKHNNQHHINVANYQKPKIGQKKVFACHKWNGHYFFWSHTNWQQNSDLHMIDCWILTEISWLQIRLW